MKKDLEDFFNASFNDAELTNRAEDWNVPSNQVWEHIQAEIVEEKRLIPIVLDWKFMAIAASFMCLISTYDWYRDNGWLEEMPAKMANIQKSIKANQSTFDQPLTSKEFLKNNAVAKELASNNSLAFLRSIEKTPTNNLSVINNNSTYATQISKPLERLDNISFESPPSQTKFAEKKKQYSFLFLSKDLGSLSTKVTPLATLATTSITPKLKRKQHWSVSADFSPLNQTIKGDSSPENQNVIASLEQEEIQEKAYAVGVQVDIPLGKNWTVETGVRMRQTENRIAFNQNVPVDHLVETINTTGNQESTLNIELTTSAGTVGTVLDLERSSTTNLANIENLNIAGNLTSTNTYVEVPITLKKELEKGKLSMNVKTGIWNRFRMNNRLDELQIEPQNAPFEKYSSDFKSKVPLDQPNWYSAHVVASVGLSYQLSEELSIYVEPTLTSSLSKIINTNKESRYAVGKMVNVGMRYEL